MSRWLTATVLLGCFAGCAFSLDGPDPARPRDRVPVCDTGKGAVLLDGVMGTALGVTALALVSADEPGVALLPLALGALYIAGAVSGNRAVDSCNEAIALYDEAYRAGPDLASDDEPRPRRRQRDPQQGNQGYPNQAPGYPNQAPGYPNQAPGYPNQQTGYPPQPPPQQAPRPVPTAQPQPPAQPPTQPPTAPVKQPVRTAPPAAPAADDDSWSDFWREVP